MKIKLTKAEIILIFATLIWGLTFPVIKGALKGIPPFAFLTLRFLLASFVIIFFVNLKIKKENIKWGIIIGIFLFTGLSLQTIGLIYTTASRSGFITSFLVFLIPIFDYLIFKKKPTKYAILGVITTTIGLYLLSSPKGGGFNFGDFLTFLSAILFALQVVFIEYSTSRYDENTIVSFEIFSSLLFSLLVSGSFEKWQFKLSPEIILAVIITGVFATSLAFIMQGKYQKETTSTKAGIIYSLEPVFALIFSFLILGETMPERGLIGGFLVFLGLIISSF